MCQSYAIVRFINASSLSPCKYYTSLKRYTSIVGLAPHLSHKNKYVYLFSPISDI